MSSHALLLRLFLSPSFFSVHVALKYLLVYADNIGITYYLTRRLRELEVQELTDVWGFVCHLLITKPTKSRAIECFVVDTAQRSTHIALITLWFMQAALNDLSLTRRDSPSFAVCQRVLHKCHEIIFSDLSPASSGPYTGSALSPLLRRHKIKHHAEPVFVGIGALLAGTPGMPNLTEFMGGVAIEQGRAEEDTEHRVGPGPHPDDDLAPPAVTASPVDEDDEGTESPLGSEETHAHSLTIKAMAPSSSALLARRKTIGSQTVPALPLHLRTLRKSKLHDPLGQLDSEDLSNPSQSSPALNSALLSARTPLRSALVNPADIPLERYDRESQSQLLRNNFCMSEVTFLLNLEKICNRLIIVPRPARVSALRAELTALNHKLPAEVCLPLWCPGSDTSYTNPSHPHHRIVRIPPGESVVLNSAERAPYLLLVEILNDELDFDPDKKSNKDVLRKLVLKDSNRRGLSMDSPALNSAIQSSRPSGDYDFSTPTYGHSFRSDLPPEPPTALSVIPATPVAEVAPDSDEEMDLVEQLYGNDQPLMSKLGDLTESIALPPTPRNKDLDLAAWSRSSPMNVHTPTFPSHSRQPSQSQSRISIERTPPSTNPSTPGGDASPSHSNILSLDEYSERMRTAAIMLAQLNSGVMNNHVTASPRPDASNDPSNPSKMKRSASNGMDQPQASRMKVHIDTAGIRDRIMQEMMSLEEERMARMQENSDFAMAQMSERSGSSKTLEDESIIRRELNKVDPSAVVFSESWAAKKSRIRQASPYGHLAQWDCMSVIVKTGGDLRQEQLAVQLIREFQSIWDEEKCGCWVKHFRILITGSTSGLIETIKDAVSIHSIKKAEYAKRIAEGRLGHVTLLDHFKSTYGGFTSAKFARAQRNFAKSLAGYSIVTYLLQVKDRHNGNILLDRDGHLIHIDFGFILSNTPGNIRFEAAPFKFPLEYLEILGGIDSPAYLEFKRLFREGFEAARKHCDRIITLVEMMQKDSALPCFAVSAEQTANQLRDRFQPTLTHSLVGDHVERLIATSLGSHWTKLYDSFQYYSQSIL
ncbi:kinase-like protein [Coprinopsis marcescibilis]|uniref:1-phosphatidylinositol 4-kinase n=1 Tax=Coprinopsis marcescibilis TaxID=230819 RepID=A0A5C3LMJ8_COPMA|nr:kinase-like protein [Coprinopsis marcescibilis]